MIGFDRKYPLYIAVKAISAFLAPFITAIIPSVAIWLVARKAQFIEFFLLMFGLVVCNLVMGLIFIKMEFVIKKKNFFVACKPVQRKAIRKILDVDYAILESAQGKKLADGAKYSYEVDWNGWNRVMDMFTPFAYNLLGIVVYTIILLPRCPWVLPIFTVMSIMNILLEKEISQRGYRKYREMIWETESRVGYFFRESTSATDGKDIRLYRMEKCFCSIMDTLVKKE